MTKKTFDKALLVIDIQENLVNPDSKIHMDTTNIDRFLRNVNHSIEVFENSGLPVFYITNEWTNLFIKLGHRKRMQKRRERGWTGSASQAGEYGVVPEVYKKRFQ